MRGYLSGLLGIAGLLLIVILLAIGMDKDNRQEIQNKIESIGGEVISIESNGVFEDDPFAWHERTKQEEIYRFTYEKDGEVHEGWVSFLYFKDIWKLGE